MFVLTFHNHIDSEISSLCLPPSAQMHLVDLAGSERIKKTDIGGKIRDEAIHINLSLHFLEQVCPAMVLLLFPVICPQSQPRMDRVLDSAGVEYCTARCAEVPRC